MEKVKIDGKEYGKIPFDLERWQNGDFVKVVTRDGRDVEQLTHFISAKSTVNLASVVSGDVHMYYRNGRFSDRLENGLDLYLIIELPQPKEIWQNLYKHDDKPSIDYVGEEYDSQSKADEQAIDERIGYLKITIFEGEKPKYELIPINQ